MCCTILEKVVLPDDNNRLIVDFFAIIYIEKKLVTCTFFTS